MILTTEYDILSYRVQADVESLRLSVEDTLTKTVKVNKTHITYNNSISDKKILITDQNSNIIVLS